jgi:N-acetylneuraminic acid mutarotase
MSVESVIIDPTNSQTLYAGTGGVYKSINGGGLWSPVNKGLSSSAGSLLAIDPTNNQTIYALNGGGFFKSTDGGDSWGTISSGLTTMRIWAIVIDPSNSQVIYVGSDDGVFKSTNGGGSWSAVNNGLPNSYVYSLAMDPNNSKILYAGTYDSGVYKGFSNLGLMTISGTPAIAAIVGVPYNFTPTSTNAISFSYTGILPPGVTFNPMTGGLNGTPTNVGTYSGIVISVINGNDTASLPPFTLTVYQTYLLGTVGQSTNHSIGVIYDPAQVSLRLSDGSAVIGTNLWLSNGSDGVYDFNSTNEPVFDQMAAVLTNGTDDMMEVFTANSSGYGGIGYVFYESQAFGTGSFLGFKIDFIRLVANSINITVSGDSTSDIVNARWEIWGHNLSGNYAPTISGNAATSATVGTIYNFTPTATNATSFSVTGSLPPGISFNTSTGTLTGTPTTAGIYSNIVVTATNVTGSASLPAFSITVSASSGSSADIWSAAGSMATARFSHTSTLLTSGKVLVSGGYNYFVIGSLSSAELYDPATNSWSSAGSMATPRSQDTATLLLNGKVLVAGGVNGGFNSTAVNLSSAELYDPATNSWSLAGPMATIHAWHTSTLLPNGKVLVAGGADSDGGINNGSSELYDPATNSWSSAGFTSTVRTGHTSTLLPSGKVLVAGGYNRAGLTISSTELYDPATNSWSLAGSMATPRDYHTATLLPNGKVLVAGGENSAGWLSSSELYDPATNSWSSAGSMATPRYVHTSTLLSNGMVLVAGGYNGNYLSNAELYDPATNSWSSTGSMATARYRYTATPLLSGTVLVAGGYINPALTLSSAELYGHFPASNLLTISGAPATATVGIAYSFTPTSTNATSFSVTGILPPGINFNTTTGSLSGTPTTGGTYSNIVISSTNASATVALPAFTITVTAAVSPVNGTCGASKGGTFFAAPAHNLCSSGTASALSGSGPWNWTCSDVNGGSTASCSANKSGDPTMPVVTTNRPTVDFSGIKSGTTFAILRSTGGGSFMQVASGTSTSFTDSSSLLSNTIYTYVVVSDTDPTQTVFMTIRTPLYNGWNIIAVPYNSAGVAASTFFASPVSTIYQWIPTGATAESSTTQLGSYAAVSTLAPGLGYFAKASNSNTLLTYSGATGPSSATVTLKPGWTMIANPNTTIKTSIGTNWLIDGNPLSNAITANKIGGGIYWWNGITYDSWSIVGGNPQIDPWKGYWLLNLDSINHTLTIQ